MNKPSDYPSIDPTGIQPTAFPDIDQPGLPRADRSAALSGEMLGELPTVSVVVLNYNGLKHLEPCFTSLMELDYPADKLQLIMIDNGSKDGSLDFMSAAFPSVTVMSTGANLGFAAGNNYGAERASGEYVAFLNNDTRVEREWLLEMVKTLLAGREEGVVCTSSLMLDWSGKKIDFQAGGVNFHGFGFQPSYGRPYDPQNIVPRELLFACGGSMLIDRKLFLEVGGFDPDYFAFFEDVDLGWRLWILGYKVTLTPTAITYHRHHGTAGSIPEHRTYVLYERNALYTIYKNYEDQHVHEILSAALLLLGQRAIRFMQVGGTDLSEYEFTNPAPHTGDTSSVHRNAVAALLAANEFSDSLEKFREKRAWLKARRKRTDIELFALFGQPGRVNWINHETDSTYAVTQYAVLNEFGIQNLWKHLPKQVLVVSPDVLPVGDIPASGSGIRAWALGKGLQSKGHHVHFTMPAPAIHGREGSVPAEYVSGAWTTDNLQSIIDSLVPDVIVSCGWPNLTWTPRVNVAAAIDLTGPHLFEREYQEYRDTFTNSQEKIEALAKGDFFTCIGERQRYYFDGWLAQAGVKVSRLTESLRVVPYSLDPNIPAHSWPDNWSQSDVRFVYGGIFLPWQDPAPALLTVASTLESQGSGMLEVIGGSHPFYPVDTGAYGPLLQKLSASPRVLTSDLLPPDQLAERYTHAHVAVDMIMPNAERELAFPSRTVFYLWCGLPVIHPAYSEVASFIRDYDAGWVVEHDDLDQLRSVVISILANPAEARRRGENAQRLVSEHFTWNRTIDDLEKFVRQPYMRPERRRIFPAGKSIARFVTEPARSAHTGPPAGYIITEPPEKRLSPSLDKVYGKRRTIASQLGSRSAGLLRAIAPTKRSRARPSAVNGQMRFALPELIAGHSQGQRFRSDHNGLSGIRLVVTTLGRRNTSRLVLHLRSNPGAARDIYSINLPAHLLKDGQPLAFRFPPVPDSAGRWFYFVADSPDGVAGDAVSLYAVPRVEEIAAQRYEDGLPAEGALLMSLEYNGADA